MTAADLVRQIEQDGARLSLTANGQLRLTGDPAGRWLPVLAQYERELIDALQASPDTRTGNAVVTQRNHGGER